MRKICNNCEFAKYTGGQEGFSETNNSPLSRFSNIYCGNKPKNQYRQKDETCDDFIERTSEIFQGVYKSKEKKK
jgi:hypothetical protein